MKLRKIVCLMLAILMGLSLFACNTDRGGNKKTQEEDKPREYYEYDYTPTHESTTRELAFYSSDSELGRVLTEYNERHMRYNAETQIHNFPIGAGRSDWKEWEAMSGSWWNTTASDFMPARYATRDIVTKWVRNPYIDNQGYVMPDNGGNDTWGLGWEFPAQETDGGTFYPFETDTKDWTVYDDCGATMSIYQFVEDTKENEGIKDKRALKATVQNKSLISVGIEERIGARVHLSPFVQMNFWISLDSGDYSVIDDLYVYFTTKTDKTFSEDKKLSFSRESLQGFSLDQVRASYGVKAFFPMYINDNWGREGTEIDKVKVVVKAKEGKTLTGSLYMSYFGFEYDDRHVINNSNYIIAAKEMVSFSQDNALLRDVIGYARKAMNFMYYVLKGKDGLITTEYLVGHDNREENMGYGIGDGYWDISAFPDKNAYINISYYNAIKSMIYLEQMAAENEISADLVTTRNEKMNSTYTYELNASKLEDLLELCRDEFNDYFWNETTQRYHVGIKYDGSVQDNGYLMFNQQAIAAGIPDEDRAATIMKWINGERTVKGDNSTGKDIYFYEFAPRFCTEELNPDVFWGGSVREFGTNVNNGGTALQLAYYDFVAQAKVSANKAGKRLDTFVNWYKKVEAAWDGGAGVEIPNGEGPSWRFYRKYYGNKIPLQGGGTGGVIGLDYEFLEASIVPRAIPDAFFGMETLGGNTLKIAPNLPNSLDYIRIENVTYSGYYVDLTAGHFFATVSGVERYNSASLMGAKVRFEFNEPKWNYEVYINDELLEEDTDYVVDDGKIIVIAPLENCRAEIKKI